MISVVLCAYNGARHLRAQLESIGAQTVLPGELIVSDDASSDESASLAREFAADASFPVIVHVNESNLGFIANFERAMLSASGDIVVLSDQDDVWLPERLARTQEAFAGNPELGLFFSDGIVVGENLSPVTLGPTSLFEYASFDPARRARVRRGDAFDVLLDTNVVTGATMAFRAGLRPLFVPIPTDTGRYHDSWIGLLASAVAGVEFSEESLIKYRQHADQVTGVRPNERPVVLDRGHYAAHASYLELVDSRLAAYTGGNRDRVTDSRRRLRDRLAHVRARAEMPSGRVQRLAPALRELAAGRYGRYSNGLRSFLRDLIYG